MVPNSQVIGATIANLSARRAHLLIVPVHVRSGLHPCSAVRKAMAAAAAAYDDALADASKCIELKGDWGKGYGRKGAALHGLGRFDEAIAAYEKGLDVEPGLAMLTNGLAEAKAEAAKGGSGGMGGIVTRRRRHSS